MEDILDANTDQKAKSSVNALRLDNRPTAIVVQLPFTSSGTTSSRRILDQRSLETRIQYGLHLAPRVGICAQPAVCTIEYREPCHPPISSSQRLTERRPSRRGTLVNVVCPVVRDPELLSDNGRNDVFDGTLDSPRNLVDS